MSKNLDVSIMGREFRVACPEAEEAALLRSVDYLDARMREIRDAGKLVGVERIAIMAALNITHAHLSGAAPASLPDADTEARARALVDEIDRRLAAS